MFLYTFSLAIAYLLCRLTVKTMKNNEEDGSLIVIQALSMTVGLAIGLTTFSIIHKNEINLTDVTPYIYVMIFSSAVMSCVMMAVNSMEDETQEDGTVIRAPKKLGYDLQFIYCLIGVILFSMFLMYDTQLIIGGEKSLYKLDLESYVLGALALYTDIVNLFAILLTLFGSN